MLTVVPPLEIIKHVDNSGTFPIGFVSSKKTDPSDKVKVMIVLCGVGEVKEKCTMNQILDRGFFYQSPKDYSLFAAACVYPMVYVFVQTTESSAYRNGEIDAAEKYAQDNFNVAEFNLITVSLGGYGALQWFVDPVRCSLYKRMVFIMPGGDGNVGIDFPSAAVVAGVETLFLHAQNDTIARPIQSVKMYNKIRALGGKSTLIMYVDGGKAYSGHGIMTRPMDAWLDVQIQGSPKPWPMWNTGTYAVTAESDKPDWSMYNWFFSAPVVNDKLIYKQEMYQKADGSIYAKKIDI